MISFVIDSLHFFLSLGVQSIFNGGVTSRDALVVFFRRELRIGNVSFSVRVCKIVDASPC